MTAYVTIAEADTYFATKLFADAWNNASTDNKQKALYEATRAINMLNYTGSKADADQEHEFPRDIEDSVSYNDDVKQACYEIAIALLDGVDPQKERENVNLESQAFAGVRATYNRASVQEHVNAGIVSSTAWAYLRRWLRDSKIVRIYRV
jgi:hypothetical protein